MKEVKEGRLELIEIITQMELQKLLLPVFVHCYLRLLSEGASHEAHHMLSKYHARLVGFPADPVLEQQVQLELEALQNDSLICQLEYSFLARNGLETSFSVQLSECSFSLLISFLRISGPCLILVIINEHISIQVPVNPDLQLVRSLTLPGSGSEAARWLGAKHAAAPQPQPGCDEQSNILKGEGTCEPVIFESKPRHSEPQPHIASSIVRSRRSKLKQIPAPTRSPFEALIPDGSQHVQGLMPHANTLEAPVLEHSQHDIESQRQCQICRRPHKEGWWTGPDMKSAGSPHPVNDMEGKGQQPPVREGLLQASLS
ncbi:hypothetical protein WJX74_004237 [Apatococcus lobatus]|uniref:TFIID subunit TAF5 NTD2 domain-containing protein n=1 Tax=Apatococcus lobatus TaxID=904363 RepID=A0AAW1RS54_9CHLO